MTSTCNCNLDLDIIGIILFAICHSIPGFTGLQTHRHSLPDIVEIQDAQELIDFWLPMYGDGDGIWRSFLDKKYSVKTSDQEKIIIKWFTLPLNATSIMHR